MNPHDWLVKADTYADIEYGMGLKQLIKTTGKQPDGEEMLTMSPEAWVEEVMQDE